MKLPKSLTTVTPLSKILALILFITFPFLGFYLGIQYQKGVNPQISNQVVPSPTTSCKRYETICDPNYTDPNGGCRPKEVCVNPSSPPQIITSSPLPHLNTKPNCTPRIPVGATDREPPTFIYPTLPPDGSYCPENKPDPVNDIACTQDAKVCPDGSFVGRQGRNCEFKKCPGE